MSRRNYKKSLNGTVTVITPVYNNDEDILYAIQSVEKQTYPNWEMIIIDDASTDKTFKMVKNYVNGSSFKDRIRVYRNKVNKGAYHSRNRGLSKARGDFITILDSDDTFHEDKLLLQVDFLNKHTRFLSVGCHYQRSHGAIRRYNEVSQLFRKKVFKDLGHFDSVRFGGDSEFIARMKAKYGGGKIGTIHSVLYFARRRPGSLTMQPETKDRGVRRSYVNAYKRWHRNNDGLYIKFPLEEHERPFPVDEKMLPDYVSGISTVKRKTSPRVLNPITRQPLITKADIIRRRKQERDRLEMERLNALRVARAKERAMEAVRAKIAEHAKQKIASRRGVSVATTVKTGISDNIRVKRGPKRKGNRKVVKKKSIKLQPLRRVPTRS